MPKVLLTILLLIISNSFMTLAWYGNLKLQDMKIISPSTSIVVIVLISWCVALLEYSFLIPANRIGSEIGYPCRRERTLHGSVLSALSVKKRNCRTHRDNSQWGKKAAFAAKPYGVG